MITKNEFDILMVMLREEKISQRKITQLLDISLGTVNKLYTGMMEKGLIKDGQITKKGFKALEPYKVKKIICLAAGFGSRMVPITLNTPKPLVRVNGIRLIDTMLDAATKAGIEEIVIVRGYLGEQFDQLTLKYPNITFVENELYNQANNIASALCVADKIENAYMVEADLLVYNPNIIRPYEYSSNMLGIKVDRTDDWCLRTNKKGIIIEEKLGGENCYQMIGISYWNKEDGKKLKNDLEKVYNEPGGKERYWEQTPFVYAKRNYEVSIRECAPNDIIEIDSFNELKQIDKSYDV